MTTSSLSSVLDRLYIQTANIEGQILSGRFDREDVISRCKKIERELSTIQPTTKTLSSINGIQIKLKECHQLLKPSCIRTLCQSMGQIPSIALSISNSLPRTPGLCKQSLKLGAFIWRNMPKTPRVIKQVAVGALLGMSGSKWLGYNLNSYQSYAAAAITAFAVYSFFNPKPPKIIDKAIQGTLFEKGRLKTLKASQETQAASLLGSFFYYNFDSVMTPERIDAAQKQTESGTTLELASQVDMPRSQGAFLSYLTELQTELTDEYPLGVVITSKDKTHAISIGLDKKGKYPIAVFDPKTSSCFYFGHLKDAARKGYELTKGSTCFFRKAKCNPIDDISLDFIPRAERIKIGSQIQSVGNHLFYNFVQKNSLHQTVTKHQYTHAEICELFTKASTYFANARTKVPINIKDLLRVFYKDNIKIADDEDEALKFFAGFYAVDAGPIRDKLFRPIRERLQRFRSLVEHSNRYNREDMDGWLQGLPDEMDEMTRLAIERAQRDAQPDQDLGFIDPANLFNQLFPPLPRFQAPPRRQVAPFQFAPVDDVFRPFDPREAERFFQGIMGWND